MRIRWWAGLFAFAAIIFGGLVACRSLTEAPVTTPAHAQGELAVILTADGVTAADIASKADLSGVPLAEAPLLIMDDFLGYDVASHTFTLTVEAAERMDALVVPIDGRAFVVAVEGIPIYAGAFWVPYSSMSYDGVVIGMLPGWRAGFGHAQDSRTYQLSLGYPSGEAFTGPDPRSDPRILEALSLEGKTQ